MQQDQCVVHLKRSILNKIPQSIKHKEEEEEADLKEFFDMMTINTILFMHLKDYLLFLINGKKKYKHINNLINNKQPRGRTIEVSSFVL